MIFESIKHLLPNARAWSVTVNKQLRQFFEGLAPAGDDIKTFFDEVWLDIFPQTTRDITSWESQFALQPVALTEQERRDRLDAAWKALGGQSPRYIQDTLQGAGFDVYVHEWWEPGTEPAVGVKQCVTARSPLDVLASLSPQCGEPLAQCGESFAQCGNLVGAAGYALVNRPGPLGAPTGDDTTWPYFLYIGAAVYGDTATVSAARQEEFEALCLKICPAQQWLGILVNYI
jgi:hypothetical protein